MSARQPETFLQLPLTEQRQLLLIHAATLNKPPAIIEKDLMVCLSLKCLFEMPDRYPMAFKGGTSLSKVYKVIDRFSEDIDVSVHHGSLGAADLPANASIQKRKDRSEELDLLLRDYSKNEIFPYLTDRIRRECPNRIEVKVEKGGEELHLVYISALDNSDLFSYIKPAVKIELGGRNVTEPSEKHLIIPDIKAAFGNDFLLPEANVDVLSLGRTFWEKVTLVHAECNRLTLKPKIDRISRHWSDLARLSKHATISAMILDRALLKSVVEQKSASFPSSSANYDDCLSGTTKLIPGGILKAALEEDYKQMVGSGMFHGDALSFDEIMLYVSELEKAVNKQDSLH
jgi:hypothetical protein